MKQTLLLLLLFPLTVFAQKSILQETVKYSPDNNTTQAGTMNNDKYVLVSPDNEWIEIYESWMGTYNSARHTFSKDSTLKKGKWYRELLYTNDSTGNKWNQTWNYYREDEGKVYKYYDNADEMVFYDFNVSLNDTFYDAGYVSQYAVVEVVKVDSVQLLDNSVRKRISLICKNGFPGIKTWIPGIGDLRGFETAFNICSADILSKLSCFYHKGQLLYFNQEFNKCWLNTSTNEPETSRIRIYPNPTVGDISITGLESNTEYNLFTLDGKKLLSGWCKDQIKTGSLPPGTYLLELNTSDRSFVRKVVKK